MGILIAVFHLVGAVVGLLALSFLAVLAVTWEKQRNAKRAVEAIALKLGVTVEQLESDGMHAKVMQVLADRFDDELLRNRLSDLCGWVRTGWEWLVALAQFGLIVGVAWAAFSDDLGNAVYAWLVIPMTLLAILVAVTFSLVCKLLTGRYPGEARAGRKSMREVAARAAAAG